MDTEDPSFYTPRSMGGIPRSPTWLLVSGVLLCVVMVGGYRSWQQQLSVDQVGKCLNTGWQVQQAENAYFKAFGRFGTRDALQGSNPSKRVFLLPGEGWKLDTTCPIASLKVGKNGRSYVFEGRPPGSYEGSCQIIASQRKVVGLRGSCPDLSS